LSVTGILYSGTKNKVKSENTTQQDGEIRFVFAIFWIGKVADLTFQADPK
jgi:hypothetical protein